MSRARGIAVLAAAAAGIGIATALATDEDRPRGPAATKRVTGAELWRVRQRVDHSGERVIGDDFACAVVHRGRLRLLVTSGEALSRAEATRRSLSVAPYTDLGVVSARFRRSTMLELRDDILASIPRRRTGGSVTVAMAQPAGPRCAPVSVGLHGGAKRLVAWRRSVVARYGGDRVRFRVTGRISHDTPTIDAGVEDR